MVRHADQNRIHEPPFTRRRETIAMEQKDQVSKGRFPHQVEDIVSADSDVMWTGIDNRSAPCVHSSGWMLRPERERKVAVTVTPR